MRVGSLCTGYGGLDMAVGGDLAFVSDIDPHVNRLLDERFPGVPNIGDITDQPDAPQVDAITAGFPCQPVSTAGRRKGTDDERWIFDDILALAGRMDPLPVLYLENVPGLLSANGGDAMARVVEGLAAFGYVGRYRLLRASDVGACHRRERWFCIAHPGGSGTGMEGPTSHSRIPTRPRHDGHTSIEVTDALATLPTPKATNNENRQSLDRYGPNRGMALNTLPRFLPTPMASMQGPSQREIDEENPKARLETAVFVPQRWGDYADAITRHAHTIGREPPAPTEDGRLNPAFVEWMMMLPAGWVTDLDLSLTAQLKILGNGVVPAQAAAAFYSLLDI